MIRRFLAVIAAAGALLGASTGAALAEYPPSSGSGAVSSTTIVVGGHVDFSGSGFAFGSPVTVSIDSAVYGTVTANGPSSAALGRSSSAHVANAAFAQPAAASTTSASFTIRITMQKVGEFTLTGSGVAPNGGARVVTAHVTVVPKAAVAGSSSSLPFTGSSALIPGLLIGVTMLAGGFVLLTSVRSRKAGSRT